MAPTNRILINCLLIASLASLACLAQSIGYNRNNNQQQRFLNRRSEEQQFRALPSDIVLGKFRAPAPERVVKQKISRNSEFGAQTVGASYRVSDNADKLPEKIVHGIAGSSVPNNKANQRTVGAKIRVSDEGLNYPPSKLSADIYGNVAEIVTAPPEAVEGDFLEPQSPSKLFGSRAEN